MDYRGPEGIARALKLLRQIPRTDDYTTAYRRISKMMPEVRLPSVKEMEVAADDIKLKTGSAGGHIQVRQAWKAEKARGFGHNR